MAKKLVRFRLYVTCIIWAIPSILFAASFDCLKAKTKTEKTICNETTLSKLDEKLDCIYRKALKTADAVSLKKDQRKWLKETLAPCCEDKKCIKKAFESRIVELTPISSVAVNEVPLAPAPTPEIVHPQPKQKVGVTVKPLICPQCGPWQVSSSDDGLIGEIVIVDNTQIVIPGCGSFDYEMKQSSRRQEDNHVTYNLSMALIQRKSSFLCLSKDNKDWVLDMEVSGHFKDGGTADFTLRRGKGNQAILFLSAWNMDREDPCYSGSGRGSSACSSIENALLFKALAMKAESAYERTPVKKLPLFSAERFSATVWKFCEHRERDSGGGHWPIAWALICQNGILYDKYKEFETWSRCVENQGKKQNVCKFPDEKFVRSSKLAAEE